MSDNLEKLLGADPAAARRLLQRVMAKTVIPHGGGQDAVFKDQHRFKVLVAGRRWGKTKIGAKTAVHKALKPNQMIWWVAPTYRVVKRGYREVLRQLPPELLAKPAAPDSAFDAGRAVILEFKNGSRLEFHSAERTEGMLGEGVDFAVLDEAAIMPRLVWEQIVRPTMMDRQGGALLISTPRGRNWFYEGYQRGQDPAEREWVSWVFPSSTNPTLEPGEIEEMRRTLPRLIFEQEVLAKFLAAGSSVFVWPDQAVQPGEVDDRTGLVAGADVTGKHVVLGIDLAKSTDYTVVYGAVSDSRHNCLYWRGHEATWREQKERIVRSARILRMAGAASLTLVMDSTGVGDPIAEEMEERGFDVVPINFSGVQKPNMVKLLARDLEDGRAFLLGEAQLEEFRDFEMNVTPAGRVTYAAPQGRHDDVVAAKMLQHWGIVEAGVPGATVIPSVEDPTWNDEAQKPFSNADDEGEDHEEWDDLIDPEEAMTDAEALEAIGLNSGPLTLEEAWDQPHLWRSRF